MLRTLLLIVVLVGPALAEIPPHDLKIKCDSGSIGKWTVRVWVNEDYVGEYDRWDNIALAPYLRPGDNQLTLERKSSASFPPVRVTLGVRRGETWSTVANYTFSQPGEEVLSIPVQVFDLPQSSLVEGTYVMKLKADTQSQGHWVLQAWINGKLVGSYRARGNVDVTPFLVPGNNTVKVKGDLARSVHPVELTIGLQREGGWTTLVNHVQKDKGVQRKLYSLQASGLDSAALPTLHVMKVTSDTGSWGKWTLKCYLNGELVQTVTSTGSFDISDRVKPGKNVVRLVGNWTEDTAPVTFTVGAREDGKWKARVKHQRAESGEFEEVLEFEAAL